MNEKEMRDIIYEELALELGSSWALNAQERVGKILLERIARFQVTDEDWLFILEMNTAMKKITFFRTMTSGSGSRLITGVDEWLPEIPALYRLWIKMFKYLHEHFDEKSIQPWLARWINKKDLVEFIENLKSKLAESERSITESNSVAVRSSMFFLMHQSIVMVYKAILGVELFGVYKTEMNKAISLIREYQDPNKNDSK